MNKDINGAVSSLNLSVSNLVTFTGILYAITLSFSLERIVNNISQGRLDIGIGIFIVLIFVSFLFFDWLLCTLIMWCTILIQKSFPPLFTILSMILAVPFLGLSLYFILSKDNFQKVIGLQMFSVFMFLIFFYDASGFYHFFVRKKMDQLLEQIDLGKRLLFGFILLIKLIVTFSLLCLLLLNFVNRTNYTLDLSIKCFYSYLIFKIILDSILATFGISFLSKHEWG